MKAIVLSCDKYHPFTNHMILAYQTLWPSNPFIFHVPWNEIKPTFLIDNYGSKVRLVRTPVEYKKTIATLIDGLDNSEWIFWCIDDVYPEKLDENIPNAVYDFVVSTEDKSILGVSLFRCKGDDEITKLDAPAVIHMGITLFEKKHITYFWWHHFCRVRVLRKFLDAVDEPEKFAKEFDYMLKTERGQQFWNLINVGRFYMAIRHMCIFGESTFRGGGISINCAKSFTKYGLPIPNFDRHNRTEYRMGF